MAHPGQLYYVKCIGFLAQKTEFNWNDKKVGKRSFLQSKTKEWTEKVETGEFTS